MESVTNDAEQDRSNAAPQGQRQSFGNDNERIAVTSGLVVAIDQFMPANEQFLGMLPFDQAGDEEKLRAAVTRYGGTVFQVAPGNYSVYRDPREQIMVLHPRSSAPQAAPAEDGAGAPQQNPPIVEKVLSSRASFHQVGSVSVDTRCLVLIDRDLVLNRELVGQYRSMWMSGGSKQARDLLRERGAAVRYGFSQQSDTLGVFVSDELAVAAIWPSEAFVPGAE